MHILKKPKINQFNKDDSKILILFLQICVAATDSFKVWFVHLSSIKFLTGYYLMSISHHNVISGYKYAEYNITTLTQYNVIILIESQNSFFIFYHPDKIFSAAQPWWAVFK